MQPYTCQQSLDFTLCDRGLTFLLPFPTSNIVVDAVHLRLTKFLRPDIVMLCEDSALVVISNSWSLLKKEKWKKKLCCVRASEITGVKAKGAMEDEEGKRERGKGKGRWVLACAKTNGHGTLWKFSSPLMLLYAPCSILLYCSITCSSCSYMFLHMLLGAVAGQGIGNIA